MPVPVGKATRVEAEAAMGGFASSAEAGPLDGGIRGRAEQSLGVDLGGVRVHQGEQATQANRELGSQAFAHGQDVVLGAGVANDANPVMAHELAHVAQQRGAQPGVAMKAEGGARGSNHEVEADHAASRIMIGAPAKISQVGAQQIMCFEGAEHMELGNAAYGGQMVTVGKVTLPAGAFTALQGDFFGTFREMEQACTDNPKLLYDYYDVLKKEGAARARHRADPAHNAEPDSNGPIMVASALNGRNPMDYLNLAATNFNHFSEQNAESKKLFSASSVMNPAYAGEIAQASTKFGDNVAQWLKMHLEAGKLAYESGLANQPLGGVGVAMDASALHYLTDAFAAGHMRVPRMEMYNEYQGDYRAAGRKTVDSLVAKIPDEIDVKAFLTQAAQATTAAVRSTLPGVVNQGLDATGEAIQSGVHLAGQTMRAMGMPIPSMPSIPPLKIQLAALKLALKARLYAQTDSLGNALGEKVAGFSAKVLHDYDNQHGVEVHNDANPTHTWVATGDHALTSSAENEKIAKQCAGASATHIGALYGQGKAHAGKKPAPPMPFVSLKPIFGLLPQVSPAKKKEGTEPGGPRDWHLKTMNSDYRRQLMDNAGSSIKDTASSAAAGLRDTVRELVESKVRELLAGLGQFADMAAARVGAIVDQIMSCIPTDQQIIQAILAGSGAPAFP